MWGGWGSPSKCPPSRILVLEVNDLESDTTNPLRGAEGPRGSTLSIAHKKVGGRQQLKQWNLKVEPL